MFDTLLGRNCLYKFTFVDQEQVGSVTIGPVRKFPYGTELLVLVEALEDLCPVPRVKGVLISHAIIVQDGCSLRAVRR